MNRKDFLRKGLLGSGVFVTVGTGLDALANNIDELKTLSPIPVSDIIGFNHIPHTDSKIMENTILHKANTRGHANHGWLDANHSFSFANYYNPDRMHFGVLRVLNDDSIDAGMGFGTHPHDNMEIITIPLEGDLEHKDSMGNIGVIKHGDIQVMSAGTGIYHSEYNKNKDKKVKLLQIWVFPNKRDVTPRYDQLTLNITERQNKLQQILSPNSDDAGVWIHQRAWFNLGTFDNAVSAEYKVKHEQNGVYAFVIKGQFSINGNVLEQRDALGVWNTETLNIQSLSNDSEILLLDVPMQA
jgi:quercetin 2,3-dioxygenase